jgi:TPR repeat protein
MEEVKAENVAESPPVPVVAIARVNSRTLINTRPAPAEIRSPWKGKNAVFHALIRECLYLELSSEKTRKWLMACHSFERNKLRVPLLVTTDIQKLIHQQDNKRLSLHTARVAVLLGVLYYLGADIPHHKEGDELAQRYFDIGMKFGLTDAYVMAGIMARRGHGQVDNSPQPELARSLFLQALEHQHPEAIIQLAEMIDRHESYPPPALQASGEERAAGADDHRATAIKLLRRAIDLGSAEAEVRLAKLHLAIIEGAIQQRTAIEAERTKDRNKVDPFGHRGYNRTPLAYQEDITAQNMIINKNFAQVQNLLDLRRKYCPGKIAVLIDSFRIVSRESWGEILDAEITRGFKASINQGEPYAMVTLASYFLDTLGDLNPEQIKPTIIKAAALAHRALITFRRLRKLDECQNIRQFLTSLVEKYPDFQELHYLYAFSIQPDNLRSLAARNYRECLEFIGRDEYLAKAKKIDLMILALGNNLAAKQLEIAQDEVFSRDDLMILVDLCAEESRDRVKLLNDIAPLYQGELVAGIEKYLNFAKSLLLNRLTWLNELKEEKLALRDSAWQQLQAKGLGAPQQPAPHNPANIFDNLPGPADLAVAAAQAQAEVVAPINEQRARTLEQITQLGKKHAASQGALNQVEGRIRILVQNYRGLFAEVYTFNKNSSCHNAAMVIRCLLGSFGKLQLPLPQDAETALQLVSLLEFTKPTEVGSTKKTHIVKTSVLFDSENSAERLVNLRLLKLCLLAGVKETPGSSQLTQKMAVLTDLIILDWPDEKPPTAAELLSRAQSEQLKLDTRHRLQNLINFCALLEHAAAVKPKEDPAVFRHFHKNKSALYSELFKRFEHTCIALYAIDETATLFSPQQEKSEGFWIFSAQINTQRSRHKKREEQWRVAKQFQHRCEAAVFDRVALVREFKRFLIDPSTDKGPGSFALTLLEKCAPMINFNLAEAQTYKSSTENLFVIFCNRLKEFYTPSSLVQAPSIKLNI